MTEYNIYCDESCHLEHDRQPIMVIGGMWCPKEATKQIASDIRAIKNRFAARGELKWTRVFHSRQDYFLEPGKKNRDSDYLSGSFSAIGFSP
jgi:hypothetical protein